MQRNNEDSLAKRYSVKLIFSALVTFLNFAIQLIVPRALGPTTYGVFTYLSDSFTNIVNIFDSSTSSAFYSKLSKRPTEYPLIYFYLKVIALVCLVIAAITFGSRWIGFNGLFSSEIPTRYLAGGMFVSLLNWGSLILISIADAYALTVHSEKLKFLQKLLLLLCLGVSFVFATITLDQYYFLLIATMLVFYLLAVRMLIKNTPELRMIHKAHTRVSTNYLPEFVAYCKPLFLLTLLTQIELLIERKILVSFFGVQEQAYFSIANQVAIVCFVLASSMTPLLMREFSVYISTGGTEQLKKMYLRVSHLMYGVMALICCYSCINADLIISIIGGEKYLPAIPVLRIMSLYPIHQTIGQIEGTMLLADERTNDYKKYGIFTLALTIIAAYLFLAPQSMGGASAGAIGMALKFVLVQLISVNIYVKANCKKMGISFSSRMISQVVIVVVWGGIAILSRELVNWSGLTYTIPLVLTVLLTGAIYMGIAVVLLLLKPQLIGLEQGYFAQYIKRFMR